MCCLNLPQRPSRHLAQLVINLPEPFPVSTRRDEIMAAVAAYPVIIVCGETGSGITTQPADITLARGRELNVGLGISAECLIHKTV